MNDSKICTKCKTLKPLDQFLLDNRRANGRGSHCRECNASYCRKRNKSDRAKQIARAYKLKHIFNISISDYNIMLEKQGGKCCICRESEITIDNRTNQVKKLAVDHCHTTGKVRGLLCANCNIGLGKFKDNVLNLKTAIEYIEVHKSA